MIGLRIYGQASFAQIFEPVLHRLDGLVWVTAFRDAWSFPPEWEDASAFNPDAAAYTSGPLAEFHHDFQLLAGSGGYLSTIDIFPKYAAAVGERQVIFGIRTTPEVAAQWLDRWYWGKRSYLQAVTEAEVSFIGDESWWEFYARNEALLTILKSHLPHTEKAAASEKPLAIDAAYEECWPERGSELYDRLFNAGEKGDR